MRGSSRILFLVVVLVLNSLTGCGYRLVNSTPSALVSGKTVWVPFFDNETVSPTAQTVLRRAFYDELHARRGLVPAGSEGDADFAMKAKIVSYSNKAVSYSSQDRVREYSLSLTVELEAVIKGQLTPLWRGQVHGDRQYPADAALALQHNAEEQALEAVSRLLAQKFISAMEESY